MNRYPLALGFLALATGAVPALGQTPVNCKDQAPAASDFTVTELFARTNDYGPQVVDNTLSEPVQMDLLPVRDAGGKVTHSNIYFVERMGKAKMYDAAQKKVIQMGTIPVWGRDDNALMGVALDPKFDENRWIYYWFSPPIANQNMNRIIRLARFKVGTDQKLDMASEKILIQIVGSKTDKWHSGGPMQFDRHGVLWITVGNNSTDHNDGGVGSHLSQTDSTRSDEWGASNTASMRGGIIRIIPDDTDPKGYKVPEGNFGEYFADLWESQGKTALAAEYRDPKKVLPEVFVKGSRSNFSLALHPKKDWVGWGEVNPASSDEEWDLVDAPVFSGYPYYYGNQKRTDGHSMAFDALRNTSPLKTDGVTELPPSYRPDVVGLASVAIAGPIYGYDSTLVSSVKFPPFYDNKWLTFDWSSSRAWWHTLDATKPDVVKSDQLANNFFGQGGLRNPVQARFGALGELYILNYHGNYSAISPGVRRVDYKGACQPTVAVGPRRAPAIEQARLAKLYGGDWKAVSREPHTFRLFDTQGREVYRARGEYGAVYRAVDLRAAGFSSGIYTVRFETEKGHQQRPWMLH